MASETRNPDAKAKYRELCLVEPTIPVFSTDWWLDAVCGDDWGVCLVEKGRSIVASMPFVIKKRFGLTLLSQPPLTQTLGPWLRSSEAKYANRLGQEKDSLSELIDQLPRYDYFLQNWNHLYTNWLPFYWRGFNQTTCYTYILPDISDLDAVWSGFRENIRREIRKANRRFGLKVRTDCSIDDFLTLNVQTFERQDKQLPYSKEFVRALDRACNAHCARRIFVAEDEQGRHHAGVYIVWDRQTAFYLMGGGAPELRASGATSLCMWEAIKFASTVANSFDFEGSMREPIERFFRGFGARQTPYFAVTRVPSRVARFGKCLTEAIRGVSGSS